MTTRRALFSALSAVCFLVSPAALFSQPVTLPPQARHNTSLPLRDIVREQPFRPVALSPFAVPNRFKMGIPQREQTTETQDPVVQSYPGPLAATVNLSFEGSNDDDNAFVLGYRLVPPDTDGDVGPNHYVQWINSVSEIFDRNGNTILGPFAGNRYFVGLGGICETNNNGDPIVLYDEQADRWLVSQFAVPGPTYAMCVAISETPDPTGSYHQYEFNFGSDFPDYPKLGIWGNSYIMTTRDFRNGSLFAGISAVAMDRAAMLSGSPASWVRFPNAFNTINDGALPADADTPVSGPALFGAHGYDGDSTFELWELDVDWTNPGAARFRSITGVPVSPYDDFVPSINQPNGQLLDDLSFFTMHRLNVRQFPTHRSMVANHTVETSPGVAGVRWYEFRDTGSGWQRHQEGTYSPDSDDRWMGSIAINANGSIALGYSRSSSTTFPSIYFAGQTSDWSATGILNVAETLIQAGSGSQSQASRWGDYSAMSVDPTDGRTFWFTTEYYAATAAYDFNTRIARIDLGDGAVDMPPVVTITSPQPESSYAEGTPITFEATAIDDNDGDRSSTLSWSSSIDGTFGTGASTTTSSLSVGQHLITASASDVPGNIGTDQISVTVTGAPGATMRVALVTIGSESASRGSKFGTAEVTVVDAAGSPLQAIEVDGFFGGSFNESLTQSTGTTGIALFRTTTSQKGGVAFCVENLTDPSGTLTYDPAANADPSYACDGGGDPGTGTQLIVSSVSTGSSSAGGGLWQGRASVGVQDENGAPVAAALVTGQFGGDVSGIGSGTTGLDGLVTVTSGLTGVKKPTATFCVTSVALAGYTYVPNGFSCPTGPTAEAYGKRQAPLAGHGVPSEFVVDQNYPNPFNPTTIIAYGVPEAGHVSLKVYSVTGQEIQTLADGYHEAGTYRAAFTASDLSAGVYLYVLRSESFSQTRRMTLLK